MDNLIHNIWQPWTQQLMLWYIAYFVEFVNLSKGCCHLYDGIFWYFFDLLALNLYYSINVLVGEII